MPDRAHERSFEIGHRGKDATGEDIAFDLGEPPFDLVEPGGVRRGNVQMPPRVRGEDRLDPRGLVRREVIGTHMHLLAFGLVGHDVGQEGDELGRGGTGRRLAPTFARLGVERGIQRAGAVTDVPKPWRSARLGDRGHTGSLRSSA